MVISVEENKDVNTLYIGEKLNLDKSYLKIKDQFKLNHDYTNMYQSVYTSAGTRNLLEPAISVEHVDGNQSLELKYVEHTQKNLATGQVLTTLLLKDMVYPFYVELNYLSHYKEDVIEQWAVIKHQEKGSVKLTKYASANLSLKGTDFYLRNYHGDWFSEMQPETQKLTHGIKTLDSKLGARTNLFQSSYFAIGIDKEIQEDSGWVLLGGLEWSGNFRIDFEKDPQENLRIIAGINNYQSFYALKANEEFRTPTFSFTISKEGLGQGSRNLHNWARKHKLINGEGARYTLLNNWESTYFDFDEQKIFQLLEDSKKLGVDLFLLDDGWFGNKYPRNSDKSSLGDWEENKDKLPNGLISIVKQAKNKNVKFGIWIEPEMVNPKSELYEKHQDWIVRQPNRKEYYFRNQLVLDLSNPEVQEFIFQILDNLFLKNPGLSYVKWDCNSVIYNAHSSYLDNQNNFYTDYTFGLYKILKRFREKYPEVPMMLCSGGGGRVDYGALKYFTEYWPSDNTDPLDRIFIQYENSLFFPAIASVNHVTSFGKQDLKFKVDVAFMGKLGFDLNLEELDKDEVTYAQKAISQYNLIKDIIWHGDLYRFINPSDSYVASLAYIDKEKSRAIMLNYLTKYSQTIKTSKPIKFKGLDARKFYKIIEINLFKNKSELEKDLVLSGDFLMKIGLNPILNFNRRSVVLLLEEV